MSRKQHILTVATDLIQTQGYDGFSYSDISKKVGIAKASIHHHFPEKKDLGVALVELFFKQFSDFIETTESLGTSLDKLRAYFSLFDAMALQCTHICPVSALQAQASTLPMDMQKKLNTHFDLEHSFVTATLETGLHKGEFQFTPSAASVALIVISTIKGALQMARLHGTGIYKKAKEAIISSLVVTNNLDN